MRHMSIKMLEWKKSPSTWSCAPWDGPAPCSQMGCKVTEIVF